jgi:glycosyltransferase involved in cell wall biosynthesis
MPVYNGADCIKDAVDSILCQTFSDFELIICDNASTDATEDICRRYATSDPRVRYFRNEENLGAAKNFNRTFELSRGEYFKWAAHDDVLAQSYLEECVRALDNSPESVVLCFPQRTLMTYEGGTLGTDPAVGWAEAGPPYDRISFPRLMRVPGLLYPILVFGLARASALRKTRLIGAYNHADLVVVAELRLLGEFREIPKPLFTTRLAKITQEYRAVRRTFKGEAAWYDPKAASRKLMPEWRLFAERVVAIRRSHHGTFAKLWFLLSLAFGQFVTRFPGWVRGRMRMAKVRGWRTWERVSVAVIRRSRSNYIPHRLWALMSGLWNGEASRIRTALGVPSQRTHARLVEFVAERLRRRPDPHAEALLAEWKDDPSEMRRRAAGGVDSHASTGMVECG